MAVRRSQLLLDSVDAVMSLSRDDLRKRWRIEFLGEPAIDAGGVMREWFELVTEQVFDPAFGLWVASANNQACVTINPGSGTFVLFRWAYLYEKSFISKNKSFVTFLFCYLLTFFNPCQVSRAQMIILFISVSWVELSDGHSLIVNSSRDTWYKPYTSICWDGPLHLKISKPRMKNIINR